MDSRAATAVVEKIVVLGLVVLFVSGLGGALLGGTVPAYRASTAEEVGDRVLAAAANGIEKTVPSASSVRRVSQEMTLPGTLSDQTYWLELAGQTLRLRHPDRAVGSTTRLALPTGITVRNATVAGGPVIISVDGNAGNRTLTIEGR